MLRKRFLLPAAVLTAAAVAAVTGLRGPTDSIAGTVPAPAAPAPETIAVQAAPGGTRSCTPGAEIPRAKFWLNNNQWGKESGTGTQCIWDTGTRGNLSWGTSWRWAGQANSVKTYASVVRGWHWGWKAQRTGLPTQLSARKPIKTSWTYAVSPQNPGTMNVAYDLWFHALPQPDWMHQPTDEVMIWLYRSGGAGPLGTKQATVTIAGTTWDLYRGDIGWNVFSFVRTGNTTSADLDLTRFTDDLTARGWLPRTKYLSGIQAGTEVFTGQGALHTSAYSVKIG
ncbi:hypothetical protein [Actinoplanes sp. NPDC051859]|uniref:GH12 family glycosyl hydrolase domain-containing protein n=1 Tax=Actinoplanes sp. NPDC051859 TaxID=3363909 RepID=UPI00378A4157